MMKARELLEEAAKVRWRVTVKTIGNNHSTLIGLLVDWWISMDPHQHWALEGGPGNGVSEKGARGQCDAPLCRGRVPVGVVEVEGYRYTFTIGKIGSFFEAHYPELGSLEFALLLLYNYTPEGHGNERQLHPAANGKTLMEVCEVSRHHPGKPILVIALDKTYVRQSEGIRARNEYYFAEPTSIEGRVYVSGQCVGPQKYYVATTI